MINRDEKYKIKTSKYDGQDYSRKAFIFVGQASTFPNMYKNWLSQSEDRLYYLNIANEYFFNIYSDNRVLDYINNPNSNLSIYADSKNYSLFALETTLFYYFLSQGIVPNCLTSHSFGEFAAFTCSGIVKFEDMLKIIEKRDEFSPEHFKLGRMLALSSTEKVLESILAEEKYIIANKNSYKQLAIIVEDDDSIKRIKKILKDNQISSKLLSEVSRPYHTYHMEETANKMLAYLSSSNIEFRAPLIPVYSSSLNKLITAGNFSKEEVIRALSFQVTNQVDFIRVISELHTDHNIYSFFEIGPQKSHAMLCKNILEKHEFNFFSSDDLINNKVEKRIIISSDNEIFKKLAFFINKVTGYNIQEISVSDNFQEDLGIDSIKKAEIIFETLKNIEANVDADFNLSRFTSLAETVNYIEQLDKNISPEEEGGGDKRFYTHKRELASVNGNFDISGVVYERLLLAELDGDQSLKSGNIYFVFDEMSRLNFQQKGYGDIILSLGKLVENNYIKKIVLFTDPQNQYFSRVISSFLKSLKKELHTFLFKTVVVESYDNDFSYYLERELNDDFQVSSVVYKARERYYEQMEEIAENNTIEGVKSLGTVLWTGGARGISRDLILECLGAEISFDKLILVGRSDPASTELSEFFNLLKLKNVNFHYIQSDILNSQFILDELDKMKIKAIDYCFNSVGIEVSERFYEKSSDSIRSEFALKPGSIETIKKLLSKVIIKEIIQFSSVVGEYGNDGQTIYSASNSMAAALLFETSQKFRDIKIAVLHLPPFDGSGMTENVGLYQKLKNSKVAMITVKNATDLILNILKQKENKSFEEYFLMTNGDQYFYQLGSLDFESLTKRCGELSPISSGVIFTKNYSLENDQFLNDHVINKQAVIPAAEIISNIMAISQALIPKVSIWEDLNIKNMALIGSEGKKLKYKLNFNSDQELCFNLTVYSEVPHLVSNVSLKTEEIVHIKNGLFERKFVIDSESIYSKDALFFGPSLHFCKNVYWDGNKCLEVVFDKLSSNNDDLLFSLLDTSFQSICVLGLIVKNSLGIPVRIEKMFFNKRCLTGDRFQVQSELLEFYERSYLGNVIVLNQNGEVVLRLEKLLLNTINAPESYIEPIIKFK